MSVLEKVKWNRLRTSLSFEELVIYIKGNLYSEDLGYGYSSFSADENVLSATYTELNKRIEITTDPLGNELEQEFIGYTSINFSISKAARKLYLLTIFNPPKSIKFFTDRFCNDLNYKVGLSIMTINLKELLDKMYLTKTLKLIGIKKAKISSWTVSDDAKASIEIISKKNALTDLEMIVRNHTYSLDKIRVTAALENKKMDFEISKSGYLSTSENHVKFLTDLIIEQLIKHEL
ncbi:hypothetical protein [Yersinia enterocolitica]|uniref:hypothetical protein n=1 Tax=Yersinia enterocolitica TaxID=630 RepID=UPI001C60B9E8|nr:hypothetical protein [Yersinia enterocolitica]MBW5837302.1 hypothetical protein [Yersinia enterocolitica]MBW5855356.1 hypothetical protein [Yersinia enterocolitica]MBW5861163.1 hypothetical protein [Yersinia enterocolitica]MBW5872070.1 hypothetical protein [Yersinia enterocolitica]